MNSFLINHIFKNVPKISIRHFGLVAYFQTRFQSHPRPEEKELTKNRYNHV